MCNSSKWSRSTSTNISYQLFNLLYATKFTAIFGQDEHTTRIIVCTSKETPCGRPLTNKMTSRMHKKSPFMKPIMHAKQSQQLCISMGKYRPPYDTPLKAPTWLQPKHTQYGHSEGWR